jgi:hypothetical protein
LSTRFEPIDVAVLKTKPMRMPTRQVAQRSWLSAIRRYLLVIGIGNFVWEVAQFPLYTIWRDGTPGHLALALAHGTGGDLLVSAASLGIALALFGDDAWPERAFWRVASSTVAFGLGFTVYSEWVNVEVRHTWAYTGLMPRLPVLGTGLSPLLEWIVIPALALWAVRHRDKSWLPH